MSKEKGILLIATKHPYYGRCAYNLALTIKAVEPEFPVCLLHGSGGINHLSESQKKIFDSIIEIPERGVEAKIKMYHYSPFEKTLYVDADNAWLPNKKPTELLNELDSDGFYAIVEGSYNIETGESKLNTGYETWADLQEMIKVYGLTGEFYQMRTEVVYFEKSERVGAMFEEAFRIYKNPKVSTKEFNGEVPDEFALNIAACIHKVFPSRGSWNPCYWERIAEKSKRRLKYSELYDGYYILSSGGNRVLPFTQNIYARVVKSACYKKGLQFLFPLQSKAATIAERKLY